MTLEIHIIASVIFLLRMLIHANYKLERHAKGRKKLGQYFETENLLLLYDIISVWIFLSVADVAR